MKTNHLKMHLITSPDPMYCKCLDSCGGLPHFVVVLFCLFYMCKQMATGGEEVIAVRVISVITYMCVYTIQKREV